ncbi:pseudouridine synthase [Macrococcus sp. DPC7161]|uniref:pseudouridine synthase n=1 Tax=Macrococcus sp. DPC7161 TaxID=2507060 RepID=UPI00100A61D9|nr:pseudouridine synthase [Macrococcus sp. DPC7161]RXK18293.1 rRNA pseudouridine synthase [Macrococcus sp. DPC7161]
MRIDKFLSNHGIGSRKDVKALIKKKQVTVNDIVIKKSDMHIDENVDVVKVNDQVIKHQPFVYIMLHKPQGVVSATEDRDQTVIDLIQGYEHYDLHPVGRLDKNTEGLLILTNDGQFTHNVLSPKKHVDKTYIATIDGIVTDKTIEQFKVGVTLDDGYETMPAMLKILSTGETTSQIEIIIQEGKFHQIKRMFIAVGMKVTYLKRTHMGQLALDPSLALGEYRLLTDEELKLVTQNSTS